MAAADYVPPVREWNWPDLTDLPPTIEDERCGIGVTIWELTKKVPFEGWYSDDIMWHLNRGETVDVNEVDDGEVRSIIRQYLRYDGANL